MRSIRSKITLLNVLAIVVAITVATIISAVSVANLGHAGAEQSLRLLCETGQSNLDYYFKGVEQSVNTVSSLIDADLDRLADLTTEQTFHNHMERARAIFGEAAENTQGVLTYYYRIDPSYSTVNKEPGFWYIDLDGKGFVENPVTDLSDDQYAAVWFNKPKETGEPVWLPPYVTDNLDVYVISYNAPVFYGETFVGVVGIEIDYKTLGEQIRDIKVLNSGYAFIVNAEDGTIVYHPYIDLFKIPEDQRPSVPTDFYNAMIRGEHHHEYTFEGVQKHCYWLSLSNGMNIVVTVPSSEVHGTWYSVTTWLIVAALIIIVVFAALTILSSRQITKPLKNLTKAAEEIGKGNYDVQLEYKGNDEIGTLTKTMDKLVKNLGAYIGDLNSLAYADALTSISNKNAFDLAVHDLQARIENKEDHPEFAIAILDCDDLKTINDSYGHDKGDLYLRHACHWMLRVFQQSTVYRIGGDEFAVILEKEDYKNRKTLESQFVQKCQEIAAFAKEPWERVSVSLGIAAYDPEIDKSLDDVVIHADHKMYQNKRRRKKEKR